MKGVQRGGDQAFARTETRNWSPVVEASFVSWNWKQSRGTLVDIQIVWKCRRIGSDLDSFVGEPEMASCREIEFHRKEAQIVRRGDLKK